MSSRNFNSLSSTECAFLASAFFNRVAATSIETASGLWQSALSDQATKRTRLHFFNSKNDAEWALLSLYSMEHVCEATKLRLRASQNVGLLTEERLNIFLQTIDT